MRLPFLLFLVFSLSLLVATLQTTAAESKNSLNTPNTPSETADKEAEQQTPETASSASAFAAGLLREKEPKEGAKRGEKTRLRVAVGYNANLDLIVRAVPLLRKLFSASTPTRGLLPADAVSSPGELFATFSHFFETGSAAERTVSNETLWAEILAAAEQLDSLHWHVGGNAALMANRFAREADTCEAVLLGGHVGERLREMLEPVIEVSGVPAQSGTADEVHLIMEYARGEALSSVMPEHSGDSIEYPNDAGAQMLDSQEADVEGKEGQDDEEAVFAPRANRFIVVRDPTNSEIRGLEPFHAELSRFAPSLVVIAGLHLLDQHEKEFREERLAKVVEFLSLPESASASAEQQIHSKRMPASVPFHLELASIGNADYMRELANELVPRVDSLGLNEQELGGLYLSLAAEPPTLSADSFKNPSVETVLSALQFVWSHTRGVSAAGFSRPLRRIHFHCLTFHILVVSDDSPHWLDSARAVAAGSVSNRSHRTGTTLFVFSSLSSFFYTLLTRFCVFFLPKHLDWGHPAGV
jgi:ADP-dependent glucokinase